MSGEIFEKIKVLINTKKEIPLEKITPDTSFEELGMDSLDTVDLVSDLEDVFNVSIPNNELQYFKTLRQAVAGLEKAISN